MKALLKFSVLIGCLLPFISFAQEITQNLSVNNDSYVNSLNTTGNFGNSSTFWVSQSAAIGETNRAFISFDFSSLPENAIVTTATLKIYAATVNGSSNLDLFVERVDSLWHEDTIHWNNQPNAYFSDQVSIPNTISSQSGWQEFDVSDHVQEFINAPWYNQGWRIRLQDETISSDYGIEYTSSEGSSNQPVLEVKYILPAELSTSVTHCTNGNTDGQLLVNMTGGNTFTESNMRIHKVVRDGGELGAASLSNVTSSVNLTYDSQAGTITADNIEPGIYRLRVYDDFYYSMGSDARFRFYKYFLVGEEGTTTSGILLPSVNYQENVRIVRDKPTSSNPTDLENQNQSYYTNLYVSTEYEDQLEYASFIQYFLDFDDQLEFTKADLTLKAANVFYNGNNSSNETKFSLVTSPWNEKTVTWNTRPTVTTDPGQIIILPETVEGYDTLDYFDSISILPFVEFWQTNPELNYGFEMALTEYNYTSWASRNYKGSSSNQNFIEFEFTVKQDPVNISGVTTHCTSGNDDASIDVTIDEGTFDLTYYKWQKLEQGVTVFVEQGTDLADADISGLSDGLYLLYVDDANGLVDYRYFFVGEEGATTNVEFWYNNNLYRGYYNEDALMSFDKATADGSTNGGTATGVTCATNSTYDAASLIKYKVDFDPALVFTKADQWLDHKAGMYRYHDSENSAWLSRVTSSWEEMVVTWDTRPTVSTENRVDIPTTTTIGYEQIDETFSILDFVEYWQNNPSENYGFELALQNYGQPSAASRDYKSSDYVGHNFIVSYHIPYNDMSASISVDPAISLIDVDIQGGEEPHRVLWSNGETIEDLTYSGDGIYWVKIWDANDLFVKYEVSVEDDFYYQNVSCTEYDYGTRLLELDPVCQNGGNAYGYATSFDEEQKILPAETAWTEFQVNGDGLEKAVGLIPLGTTFDELTDINHGIFIKNENEYQLIKNGQLDPVLRDYKRNDIFKVQKTATAVVFTRNGTEVDFVELDPTITPIYLIGVQIQEGAAIKEIRYGTVTIDPPTLPCAVSVSVSNDILEPVTYCPEDNVFFELTGASYYRWYPSTGLSCDDCPNPTIENGAAGTYQIKGYHSYLDFLAESDHCGQTSVEIVPGENCITPFCQIDLSYFPVQQTYCPGDIIQFNLDGAGLDHVVWEPASFFNCNECLDPQFTFEGGSVQIDLTLYETAAHENACATESVLIIGSKECDGEGEEGLTFNNYGAVVWLEKDDNDVNSSANINMHCNYLNEKVMLSGEQYPVSGKIINEGKIRVEDNWTNNGETFDAYTYVFGIPDPLIPGFGEKYNEGRVELFGAYQRIKGVSKTAFFYLDLSGTGKKEMFIDADVRVQLNLSNIEIATRNNILHVLNTDNNAITNPNLDIGFVSSDNEGVYLRWNLDPANNPYIFPLGSSLNGLRFKPLTIDAYTTEYVQTRLVNYNPLYNGLDEFAPDVETINGEYFYYIIPENLTEPLDIGMHFNLAQDGNYQHIAHWDNEWALIEVGYPRWEKTANIVFDVPTLTLINDTRITTENWSYFVDKEFVLSKAGFVLDFNDFGDSGDGSDDDVYVEIISTGNNQGGGVGSSSGTGPGNGGNTYTPNPVEGTYQLNVNQLCGVDGIIQFTVDNSGNIVQNSVYYIIDPNDIQNIPPKPLAEDLYNLGITGNSQTNTNNGGILGISSIPQIEFVCANNVQILLSDGILLESTDDLQVQTPGGVTVENITIYDLSNSQVATTTSSSWTPSGLTDGVYKLEVVVNDGSALSTIKGVFIFKNI